MEESILYPSPNWFLPSILGVSKDGWLVYGGPSRTLVVLEPLSSESGGTLESNHRHKAHVVSRTHKEKIVTVDISPEWPEKRRFVSGSCDGTVKEWTITLVDNKWAIKNTHTHDVHANEKEEVICVGYSMATHIVSVGNFSNIAVWELNTNVTQSYNNLMRSFKATCMSCSPHLHLVVAVGTKQGVVFVLDLNGRGKVMYKVRGQDDEIAQVAWCPQYEVVLKRSLEVKKSLATQRLEKIRNEPEPSEQPNAGDASGVNITLPNDSFDESVVQEDDMFDIYKDHEANEFGHKKYQPEDIVVKKKDDTEKNDFLAECEKLKAQILKNKQEDEEPIANLVEAMDKAHLEEPVGGRSCKEVETISGAASLVASGTKLVPNDGSAHIHKHLLASISKNGTSIRIWSKTGKIVATCAVIVNPKTYGKQFSNKQPHYASLCWYKPNSLLIADGKANLVECNPLQVDCRNKLHWSVVHSVHRRGVYFVTTDAPRVQSLDTLNTHSEHEWSVWTAAQDRYLLKYDMKARKILAKYGTCGGYIYDVRPCPYDAGKLSISVGDGAVRIWENRTTGEDENKLTPGEVTCFWQNVQGKILQTAWHPTRENLLAFSTAESRVGLIDTSKPDRPAKVLQTVLPNAVYSIAWGDNMTLFAIGGKELVMYQANKPDQAPIPIHIEIEGQKWEPCVVNYSSRGLTVGSFTGGVAVFSGPGGQALAAKFVFTRMIHAIEWHPQQTSSSDEESKYKNLLAICSPDKTYNIVIIQYEDKEGGGKQFSNFTTLTGHTNTVFQIYWSPHRDGQILSTSLDCTVRVWDAINGVCMSIFAGHSTGTLGAAWCPQPQLADKLISGGNDYCLRLWDMNDHPAENYKVSEVKKEQKSRKRHINKIKLVSLAKAADDDEKDSEDEIISNNAKNVIQSTGNAEEHLDEEIASDVVTVREPKTPKRFLMPILTRQLNGVTTDGPRLLILKYIEKNKGIKTALNVAEDLENCEAYDVDVFKLFGTINDVNEILDMECQAHLALKAYKEYMMLMIFRGRIDSVIQFANEHDLLDPFLLSVAPCVSFKYWKDVMQLYIAQIDRLAIKKPQEETFTPITPVNRVYGGPVYRKVAALLSIHDVKGAVDVLEKANLFKEAYILCRCRYMDSIADQTLAKWASYLASHGDLSTAALLNIAMGKIKDAANILRRSNHQENLNLAAELAKLAGLSTFADYIETKVKSVEKESTADDQLEETLADLPTRMELLMKENKVQNGEAMSENTNGDQATLEHQSKDEVLVHENKVHNGEANGAKTNENSNNESVIDT